MFTSEPSLAQRIERMIGDVPIVDARSHLDPRRLQAPDLAALIAEPPLRRVLIGVGMPVDSFDPARPADERVVLALPFLRQVRNTSAAWCFARICRDLYAFDEPHLTPDNYRELYDRVAASASDPAWGLEVLRRRARISHLVAPVPAAEPESPGEIPDFVRYRFDIVGEAGPETPTEVVQSGVFGQLDELINDQVRFAAFSADPLLDNAVHAAVLEWHQMHGLPVQVVVADVPPIERSLTHLERLVRRFPAVRFAFMNSSQVVAPDLATLAGVYPNVFTASGDSLATGTMVLEQNVLARIQRAGATKIGGFSSGATSAEWVYGTLQATRKATASALAQAVAGGFFEEDEIPPLLRAIFAESPIAWYRLDG